MLFWRFLSNSSSDPTLLLNNYGRRTPSPDMSHTHWQGTGETAPHPQRSPLLLLLPSPQLLSHELCHQGHHHSNRDEGLQPHQLNDISTYYPLHFCYAHPYSHHRVKMIKIREHADLNQEDPISLVTDSSLSRDIAKQKRLLCCGPYKSLSLKMVLPSQWRVQCVKGCGAGQTFLERPSVFQCIILFWF